MKNVEYDWQIDDLEAELPASPVASRPVHRGPAAGPAGARWLSRRRAAALAVTLVLALGTAGGGVLWQWQRYERQVDADVRALARLEGEAYATQDREVFMAVQDDDRAWREWQGAQLAERGEWPVQLPYSYTARVLAVRPLGDGALAEIEETRPLPWAPWSRAPRTYTEPVTLRRAAFYRRTPGGWVHAAPPAGDAFWGGTRTLTRGRFTLVYPALDETSARGWMALLAPFGDRVCADLGCGPDVRWTITFSRTPVESPHEFGIGSSRVLTFTSPSLAGYLTGGRPRADQDLLLASNTVVAALEATGGESLFGEPSNTPYAFAGLGIYLYEIGPAHSGLDAPGVEAFWQQQASSGLLGRLVQLFDTPTPEQAAGYIPLHALGDPSASLFAESQWATNLAESYAVVDYVATVHGRERLGDLLRAARTTTSLGAALQQILASNDPVALERAWQAYGRGAYGR